MEFHGGDKVEVCGKEEGFLGSYYAATTVKNLVEEEDMSKHLIETHHNPSVKTHRCSTMLNGLNLCTHPTPKPLTRPLKPSPPLLLIFFFFFKPNPFLVDGVTISGMICIGQKHFQKALELLHNDNNLGLVKQVISSMYKRNIQRLTQTYWTLSLQDIAKIVQLSSLKEAEMHVLQMVVFYAIILDAKLTIEDGEIYATINQKDGMVRFLEDPEQCKNCEMIEHIDSLIHRN
ncbi:hypothetical protein POTOM_039666 [Populus tomentosa]|uniref:PCI domain-containing protein n=1 Tax=Populus tomentosa TaxID=118781 RepID=A0A8X7YT30_POPTO|nr:hypothetical protein POTOM_039666 [Populus tomentosa]